MIQQAPVAIAANSAASVLRRKLTPLLNGNNGANTPGEDGSALEEPGVLGAYQKHAVHAAKRRQAARSPYAGARFCCIDCFRGFLCQLISWHRGNPAEG